MQQRRLEQIESAWDKLHTASVDKRQKLQYAQKGEQFIREADEVLTWMNDRMAIASSSEPGKDLEHVELLQAKFDEFSKVCTAQQKLRIIAFHYHMLLYCINSPVT